MKDQRPYSNNYRLLIPKEEINRMIFKVINTINERLKDLEAETSKLRRTLTRAGIDVN